MKQGVTLEIKFKQIKSGSKKFLYKFNLIVGKNLIVKKRLRKGVSRVKISYK